MADSQDDIVFDDAAENLDDSVVAEEHMGEQLKKLREKLKAAESKAKEYLDSWQRAQADFANLRKRDEEAKVDFLKFAKSDVLSELIPVLDALNLAVTAPLPALPLPRGGKEGGVNNVEPIYKLFMQILKSHGLEEINPLGEAFDPRFHEAISMIGTAKEEEDGKVLEVMQKGYILSGKILRPAKVKVGEFKN